MKIFYTQQKQFLAVVFLFLLTNFSLGQCWSKVAVGGDHTVAIATNGSLWSWGLNNLGQLGNGTYDSSNVPVQIGTATDWTDIVAGDRFTVALRATGFINSNKTLWTWGSNNSQQLGGGALLYRNYPLQIGTNQKWVDIAAGREFVLAIQDDGSVLSQGNRTLWGWGSNQYYQLGIDGATNTTVSAPLQIGTNINWSKVCAGYEFSIARKTDGTLWGWGRNNYGQIGLNSISPSVFERTQIGTNTGWSTNISAGGNFALATLTNGTLFAWGYNNVGQLGIGSTTNQMQPTLVGTNFNSIAAGGGHSLAITVSNTISAFGYAFFGQLGFGNSNNLNVPTQLNFIGPFSKVAASNSHSVVIKNDGTLWAFGKNVYGQLGDGTIININIPTEILCPNSLIINEQKNEINVTIFPNPSSNGAFSIQSKNNSVIIIAFDMLGKQISIEKNDASYKLNASSGLYVLKIIDTDGNIQIKKLIIQ